MGKIILKDLKFYGYHGAFEFEQTYGQRFLVNVEMYGDLQEAKDSNNLEYTANYVEVYDLIKEIMEGKQFNLLEALTSHIGQSIMKTQPLVQKVVVEVKKPEIPIPSVCDYFSVIVTTKREVTAYIALGSNKGDKKGYLDSAVRQLQFHPQIDVEKMSSYYVTDPVGYLDQDEFLNRVIEIKASLKPNKLLEYCQHIETNLFRERMIRFGPRTIDLDVLLYNEYKSEDPILTIPHPRMLERSFVMMPLNEIAPDILIKGKTVNSYVQKMDQSGIKKYEEE